MIKASLILAAALCIIDLLRRRSAAERHMLWTAAIISAALLPLLTLVLPSWQSQMAGSVAAVLPTLSRTNPSGNPQGGNGVIVRAEGIDGPASPLPRLLIAVWIGGSVLAFVILIRGTTKLARIVFEARPVSDPQWKEIEADLSRSLGLRRTARLLQSSRGSTPMMPMTFGLFHPRVLLPACANDWSDERRRVVLAHELAHVRRWDFFFQIAAQLACAVYWFNPLFWIACSRQRWESERACDDEVLHLGVDAQDYAAHLLEIARALKDSCRGWPAALAMARQSGLEQRFAALLNSSLHRAAVTRNGIAAVTIATFCLVLPLAGMRTPDAAPAHAVEAAFVPPQVEQYTTPPLYSDEARSRRIEGVVKVEVRVDVNGNAEVLRLLKGLGFGLDENALLALRTWRFVPGRRDGGPAEMTTEVDVEFNLRTAELNELIANDMAARVGPDVSPPLIVHRVEPQPPENTKNRKPEGSVVLDVVVLEDGTPKIVRIIRSLSWELDEKAIKALEQWRFSPAIRKGMPVKVRLNVGVNFNQG